MKQKGNNYYAFADNDREYLEYSFKGGAIFNSMCALTQNTCEKYMKYLVDTFVEPTNREEQKLKTDVLRAHNLKKIKKYIEKNLDVKFNQEKMKDIMLADGYYFATRYPGEDSFFADKEDIEICMKALHSCKEEVDRLSSLLQARNRSQDQKEDGSKTNLSPE